MTIALILDALLAFDIIVSMSNGEFVFRLRRRREATAVQILDEQNKENAMYTINADASRTFHIKFVDKKGRPARVDGIPTWTLGIDGVGSLFPAGDGLSCEVKSLGIANAGVGLAVNADADLGGGVRNITGTATIQFLAPEAAGIELSADDEVAG